MSPQYPEHEKLRAISGESQVIGDFLEWFRSTKKVRFLQAHEHSEDCQGPQQCGFGDEHPFDLGIVPGSIADWLAEYFEIDQTKIDNEKRAMLEDLRKRSQ